MLREKQTDRLFCPSSSESRVCKRPLGPLYTYTYTHKIKEIENVQGRAIRFVKNDNNGESSVTLMMQDLKWDSLERRREVSRLTLFYKAIHQETAIPFPNHLVHSINKKPVALVNDLFRYRLKLRYMPTVSLLEQ